MASRVRKSVKQRILDGIERSPSGCWIWTGHVMNSGYGGILVDGKKAKVHRVAYQEFVGPITTVDGADYRGTCVLHKCDEPRCANPDHLFLGSHQDNMTDKANKGRVVSNPLLGERHQNAKLTANDVIDIRCLRYLGAGVSQIAKSFNVARSTIHSILNGATWVHV